MIDQEPVLRSFNLRDHAISSNTLGFLILNGCFLSVSSCYVLSVGLFIVPAKRKGKRWVYYKTLIGSLLHYYKLYGKVISCSFELQRGSQGLKITQGTYRKEELQNTVNS